MYTSPADDKQDKVTRPMTVSATYNRQTIMTQAHAAVELCLDSAFYAGRTYAQLFAIQLRRVWSDGKCRAATRPPMSEVESLRDAISMLQNKDRWTQADYATDRKLRDDLATASAHERAEPEYAEKRELIAAAGGRFCAVTFTKADGTTRIMQVQPATLRRHVKGDRASARGRRASATRKARHPHLPPVWDAKAKAPRSINLATVSRIAVDGQVHDYRA